MAFSEDYYYGCHIFWEDGQKVKKFVLSKSENFYLLIQYFTFANFLF